MIFYNQRLTRFPCTVSQYAWLKRHLEKKNTFKMGAFISGVLDTFKEDIYGQSKVLIIWFRLSDRKADSFFKAIFSQWWMGAAYGPITSWYIIDNQMPELLHRITVTFNMLSWPVFSTLVHLGYQAGVFLKTVQLAIFSSQNSEILIKKSKKVVFISSKKSVVCMTYW